ncbi:gamma-parvin isoform X1 [Falco naumanni]|uniref:gamma-parvin isoform X1 n=2 Tax=Falco naumanni TaxID=148594 RepID=UPI001ADEA7DA|nr:gamma-parvin isoform X1 [Falco naumanni]
MGGCSFGAGRAEPGGPSPPPTNFIAPAVRRSWKSFQRIAEGENIYQEREKAMDPASLNVLTQPAALNQFLAENAIAQGEKKKLIKPTSSHNTKLEELKLLLFPPQLLIDWINTTLKEEHIVVKSLEEDLYDGLVLHHLLENLGSLKLDVDKIALTEKKQRQKLSVILEAVAKCLQLEESQLKWSVESILTKDLLSTLHLLVAIAKHFKPSLAMPPNVQVETITIENTSRGLKTANAVEYITENKESLEVQSKDDAFDELFSRAPDKLDAVKKVFLQFVNQHVGKLGLNVKDIESQFADGVILLLLIGQLEGYFLNLRNFFLTPASTTEMLHNVNLALDLLADGGLLNFSVNSEDIVNGDVKTTMRILYCLYSKYKTKET